MTDTIGIARRRGTLLAAVAGLVTGSLSPALAQGGSTSSKFEEILRRGRLVVGIGSDIPPFYFLDESNSLVGFEVDLARLLARGLFGDPSKVEFVIQSSDARIPNLMSNRVDMTIQNLTVTPARAQQAEFSVAYYRAGQGFLLRTNGRYKDGAELKAAGAAVRVSANQNPFSVEWAHEVLPGAQVDLYPSPDAALQALDAGRADAHMIVGGRIAWTVKLAPDRYRDSGIYFRPNSIGIGVRPGDQRWLNWLNTALREMMGGVDFAEYAAIYKKWLGIDVPIPQAGYPREGVPA